MSVEQTIIESFNFINQKPPATKIVISDWSLWLKLVKKHLATININCQVFKKYCLSLADFKNYWDLNNVLAMGHYLQLLHCQPQRFCAIENQARKKITMGTKQDKQPILKEVETEIESEIDDQDLPFADFNDDDLETSYDPQQNLFQSKAQAIQDGTHQLLKDVGKHGLLTPEQELAYFKKLEKTKDPQKKKKLRHKIANSNLPLVVANVKKYSKSHRYIFADLIMEGIKGLLQAIDKFEWQRGYKFSTYANFWIFQAIHRGLNLNNATIKIPDNVNEEIYLLYKAGRMWIEQHGEDATVEQLAAFINKTWNKDFSVAKIKELQSYRKEIGSLNKKIGVDEDDQILDFIVDNQADPAYYSDQNLINQYLSNLLNRNFDHIERIYIMLTTRIKLKINDRFKISEDVINHCDLDKLISAEDKAYVITIIEAANRKFHLNCACVQLINQNKSTHIIKKSLTNCKQTQKLTLSQIKFWMQKQIVNYDKLFGQVNTKDARIYKKGYLKPYQIDQKVTLTKAQLNAITYQCPIWTRDRLKPIERKIKIKLETLRTDQLLHTFALEQGLID